jgi:hypothetical protein
MLPLLIPAALALAKEFLPDLVGKIAGDTSGRVAGAVLDQVESMTGTREPDAAAAILRADPDKVLALRGQVIEAYERIEVAYLADRQSARAMAVERVKAGGTDMRANLMIAGATAVLLACIVVLVAYREGIPGEAVGIISTVAGLAGGCLKDAFGFEFGSSRGSKDKDTLAALARE